MSDEGANLKSLEDGLPRSQFVHPVVDGSAFNCPCCSAYAHQSWSRHIDGQKVIRELLTARCDHCLKYSVWWDKTLIYPATITVELPSNDLPPNVRKNYEEAAQVLQKSPRAAAALLRLAIQYLCKSLGGSGNDLSQDIAKLVKDGLPVRVQKTFDFVRVIGNNAVHPGVIDIDDNPQIAEALFRLVNFIAEKMITEPKAIDALFDSLPEENKKHIATRDKQAE